MFSENERKNGVTMRKESKRYFVSKAAGIILTMLAALAILKGMEGLASSCVAGILTILTTYIWGETKRPSNHNETKPNEP